MCPTPGALMLPSTRCAGRTPEATRCGHASKETALTTVTADSELKSRHRAMWASGDYPRMVDTWLLPIGQRLVEASGIKAGDRVLDVAAGTGNASIPAAQRGASV